MLLNKHSSGMWNEDLNGHVTSHKSKDLCLRHVTLARQGKSMNKNIIKRMDTTLLKNKSPLIYRY